MSNFSENKCKSKKPYIQYKHFPLGIFKKRRPNFQMQIAPNDVSKHFVQFTVAWSLFSLLKN